MAITEEAISGNNLARSLTALGTSSFGMKRTPYFSLESPPPEASPNSKASRKALLTAPRRRKLRKSSLTISYSSLRDVPSPERYPPEKLFYCSISPVSEGSGGGLLFFFQQSDEIGFFFLLLRRRLLSLPGSRPGCNFFSLRRVSHREDARGSWRRRPRVFQFPLCCHFWFSTRASMKATWALSHLVFDSSTRILLFLLPLRAAGKNPSSPDCDRDIDRPLLATSLFFRFGV